MSTVKDEPSTPTRSPEKHLRSISGNQRICSVSSKPNDSDKACAQGGRKAKQTKRKREPKSESPQKSDDSKKARTLTRKDLEYDWDRSQIRDPRETPERVVLPRRTAHQLSDEEKALFRGPPIVKRRGVSRDEIFKAESRQDISSTFHELYICFDKGPQGSPTYDTSGFQLDYAKVADWMKPRAYSKKGMMNAMDKSLAKRADAEAKMAKVFFQGGSPPTGNEGHHAFDLLKDKVSKDLGIAWHKIGPAEVQIWADRGFPKEDPQKYKAESVTAEERKRFSSLLAGGSLRK